MNILIAPNAFKNSLDAQSVAEAIALGLTQSRLECNCRVFPVGDGGDGTGSLLISHLDGQQIDTKVQDPLGRELMAGFGWISDNKTAIIEMADASGMRLLTVDELSPMNAGSFGTGQLIKAALYKGADRIIIGMGGSATVDGGMGILAALGFKFLDAGRNLLKAIPQELISMESIDISDLDQRIYNCQITILCDVDNLLLGYQGAAAVFGPQKGATAADVLKLDTMLAKLAAISLLSTGKDITTIKHGGTAGGAAAGLHAFLNAELVGGAAKFLELTNFDDALQGMDLVITGEGSIDEQTLQGKAPFAVADAARAKHIKVIGLAGKVPETPNVAFDQHFYQLISINKDKTDLQTALKDTRVNLIATARGLGDRLADASK